MKHFLQDLGIAVVLFLMLSVISNAYAQTLGTPGTKHYGDGIGGCSKDGKWCWNIQIDQPHGHKPWPRSLHGRDAIRMMSNGKIVHTEMTHYGILYLGVYDHDGWHWDCQVNPRRGGYSCHLSH